MVLVVNTTADATLTERLRQGLAGRGVDLEVIEAGGLKIGPCIGCNFCWLKTPGICSVKDDYETILKSVVHAEQLWVISDTALGFLDHKGKNVIDRLLPIATMYLKFKDGQMRHVMRYVQRTDIGLIYTGAPDREYLERWCARVALNFDSTSLGVYPASEMEEALRCMR